MSRNRSASGVYERDAAFITFDQTRTGGRIGNPSVDQEAQGYGPNVQAAIDDMWAKVLIAPGSIYQSISSTSPSVPPTVSRSQTTTVTAAGVANADSTLSIAGVPVAVNAGNDASLIATKIGQALTAQPFMSNVAVTGTSVTYTWVDTFAHPTDNYTQVGVTISSTTSVRGGQPGYLGYGSWELLGSETKYGTTIYSWLRIA